MYYEYFYLDTFFCNTIHLLKIQRGTAYLSFSIQHYDRFYSKVVYENKTLGRITVISFWTIQRFYERIDNRYISRRKGNLKPIGFDNYVSGSF